MTKWKMPRRCEPSGETRCSLLGLACSCAPTGFSKHRSVRQNPGVARERYTPRGNHGATPTPRGNQRATFPGETRCSLLGLACSCAPTGFSKHRSVRQNPGVARERYTPRGNHGATPAPRGNHRATPPPGEASALHSQGNNGALRPQGKRGSSTALLALFYSCFPSILPWRYAGPAFEGSLKGCGG